MGELCTRGYSTMLGYWGDDERTQEVIISTGAQFNLFLFGIQIVKLSLFNLTQIHFFTRPS